MSRAAFDLRPLDSKVFWLMLRKQLALYCGNLNDVIQTSFYFILAMVIFHISIGANEVQQEISIGIIFSSLLLSIMLGMQSFFKDEYQNGELEQYIISGVMLETVIISKCVAFILINALMLFISLPLAFVIMDISFGAISIAFLAGLFAIIGASFVNAFCASVSINSTNKSLFSIITLPLLIPILIFATFTMNQPFYLWFLAGYDTIAAFMFSIATRYVLELSA